MFLFAWWTDPAYKPASVLHVVLFLLPYVSFLKNHTSLNKFATVRSADHTNLSTRWTCLFASQTGTDPHRSAHRSYMSIEEPPRPQPMLSPTYVNHKIATIDALKARSDATSNEWHYSQCYDYTLKLSRFSISCCDSFHPLLETRSSASAGWKQAQLSG